MAEHNGLVFNSRKCTIQQPQITFYVTVFTHHGMKPNPAKVYTLQDLPTPVNQKNYINFFSLINYLQSLIPDLSDKTVFLRAQTFNRDWNPSTDSSTKPSIIMTEKNQHQLVWTWCNTTTRWPLNSICQ